MQTFFLRILLLYCLLSFLLPPVYSFPPRPYNFYPLLLFSSPPPCPLPIPFLLFPYDMPFFTLFHFPSASFFSFPLSFLPFVSSLLLFQSSPPFSLPLSINFPFFLFLSSFLLPFLHSTNFFLLFPSCKNASRFILHVHMFYCCHFCLFCLNMFSLLEFSYGI